MAEKEKAPTFSKVDSAEMFFFVWFLSLGGTHSANG